MHERLLQDNTDSTVNPSDDPDIKDEHEVIRRISEQQIVTNVDGKKVSSSMVYKASSGKDSGMSVDLKQLIENAGKDPKKYVTTPRWMGSVILNVGDLRKLNFQVRHDPTLENPYHGEVRGKFSKSKSRELARLAKWFVPIDDVFLS